LHRAIADSVIADYVIARSSDCAVPQSRNHAMQSQNHAITRCNRKIAQSPDAITKWLIHPMQSRDRPIAQSLNIGVG
jgi:hypothetical protein